MSAALNGRLTKLEQTAGLRNSSNICARCGLRHVQPLTIDLIREVIGPISTPAMGAFDGSGPLRLCVCEPCYRQNRWFARRSHGLDEATGGV